MPVPTSIKRIKRLMIFLAGLTVVMWLASSLVLCKFSVAIPIRTSENSTKKSYIEISKNSVNMVKSDVRIQDRSLENKTLTEIDRLIAENKELKEHMYTQEEVISFLSQPNLNEHSIKYMFNPSTACAENMNRVLFIVPSKPTNFDHRNKVRQSERGKFVNLTENGSKLFFFLGRVPGGSQKIQRLIEEEIVTYRDIVQIDFLDTYANILQKTVSMLHWVTHFCSNASFVVRTDDDVKVNVTDIISALEEKRRTFRHFLLGEIQEGWEPIRNRHSKYFLSMTEYPHPLLPRFAIGGLLGFPAATAALLYQCALRLKPIWLDDVFISGLCAPKVGVTLIGDPRFSFKHWDW
ncbi:beta-1 3-galactosyltransferase 1 [Biomphalaria pfeifferi]|uniref:Hexosyltransferase n=1 Tax=Biomphalaria pfeifferi TaxID=112525 RepID=A0AAD8FKT9_BIOPF|nr:beta-1 3-galactosyltransferase 1 [Biomphalaria pfeifferi]